MVDKQMVERSLKRFLKRKIAYTAGLLVGFLITGAISPGSAIPGVLDAAPFGATPGVLDATPFGEGGGGNLQREEADTIAARERLLAKIAAQRAEIEALLAENEAKLQALKDSYMDLVREGDWYSKPRYPSYFATVLAGWREGSKERKDWDYGIRTNTTMDVSRETYNAALAGQGENTDLQRAIDYTASTSGRRKGSSGWISGTEAYNDNTHTYDYEDLLMILPVVQAPEAEKPTAPTVAFAVPAAPAAVNVASPQVLNIAVGAISVSTPAISAPTTPVLPLVTQPLLSVITVSEPNVTINPITISVGTATPTFSINPVIPTITMNVKSPETIEEPNPTDPNRTVSIVQPSASPFTSFAFNSSTSAISVGNTYMTLYSGIDPNTIGSTTPTPKLEVGQVGGPVASTRPTNILYRSGPALSYINVYVMGYPEAGGYADSGSGANNNALGTIAFHTLLDGKLQHINAYLYGRAGLMTAETWRHGQVTMTDVNVYVYNSDNSVYYVMPAAFKTITNGSYLNNTTYLGALKGESNINIYGTNNSVYLSSGISGPRLMENTGTVQLEGAGNIIYSGMGYTPNWAKTGHFTFANANKMNSAIKLTTPAEIYGDENIILFFGSKTTLTTMPTSWETADINAQDLEVMRKGSYIGIYQGEIEVTANIGIKLDINGSATQTTAGQVSNPGIYTDITVDGSVGIYAKSGQRPGIIPTKHLGVPITGSQNHSYLDSDPIHNLEVAKLDIHFGPYSKNGFMVAADLGTIIDIGYTSSTIHVSGVSTYFTDGINGTGTVEVDAATGTIIAYATGTWDQAVHRLGYNSELPVGHASLVDPSGAQLQGQPSEINVHIPLTMTAKEGIAYMGDDHGKVNVGTTGSPVATTATGHKSIIGYARNYGVVTINGAITAVDAGASTKKYQNIGAYAGANGTVIVNGNATINGIGAFANGTNAVVELKGTNNTITTGVNDAGTKSNGGLAALNGGTIKFYGGTIIHADVNTGDHAGTIPFYADASSRIEFRGPTQLQIGDGAVFYGQSSDYDSAFAVTAKYAGMANVSVLLTDNGVDLGVFKGENITWTTEAAYLNYIASIPKMNAGAINPNGHWYNTYLEGGTLLVNANVNLDGYSSGAVKGSDAFNDIIMEREKVTINTSIIVTSTTGRGLVLGSNAAANSAGKNADSGYTNNGTVKITGNNSVGLFTSYGYIDNTGTISVDEGIAAVGVNGSILKNTGTISTGGGTTSGAVGIAGLATKVNASGVPVADAYGTDTTDSTTKLIEIENQGTITVGGANGVAIYANNNTGAAGSRNRVTVSNNKSLLLGDGGVGVMVKGTNDGGTVNLTSTGGTDIAVGINGIGVYAEQSTITLNGTSYEIEVKDDGVGVLVTKNSTVNTGSLKLKYTGALNKSATALVYQGSAGTTGANNITIDVATPSGMTGSVSGIYATGGGTLNNSGAITATAGGAYGIIALGVDVINSGLLTTGSSSGSGGVAIYANDGAVTTNGDKLVIDGANAVGIYAYNNALSANKTITVNQGTGNLQVLGTNAVGIYVKDKAAASFEILTNSNAIDLTPSASAGDRRIGIFLEDAKNTGNTNTGALNVTGTTSVSADGYNIGIYSLNSTLTNSGTVTVNGVGNIGIAVESGTGGSNSLNLSAGNIIDVRTEPVSNADLSIGVYGKGNSITVASAGSGANITVRANAVGIYLDGNSTSTITGNSNYSLYSDAGGKTGIGVYLKDGALYASGIWHGQSDGTATDGAGDPVRPIGIYYGTGSASNAAKIEIDAASQEMIGMYGKQLTSFTNSGAVEINANSIGAYFQDSNVANTGNVDINGTGAYGLYFKGGQSTVSGTTTVAAANGIGVAVTGTVATAGNTGTMNVTGSGAIGAYTEAQGKFVNDTGGILTAGTNAMGGYTAGGVLENKGMLTSSKVGFYAKDGGSALQTTGIFDVLAGIGIIATGTDAGGAPTKAELTGGTLTTSGAATGLVGVYADNGAEIELAGSAVTLTTAGNAGLYILNGVGTLISGDITVGAAGTALYGKTSSVDLSNYTGTFYLGNKGIGLYSEDNSITGNTISVDYNSASDKGVGIYYKGSAPVTNNIEVLHRTGGQNLVHLYADGVDVTNTANQKVYAGGIGFFLDNGSISANQGTIDLDGAGTVGIYLDKTVSSAAIPVLTNLGTIIGSAAVTAGSSKVGVYVRNGDITGAGVYNFAVDGGVALYLENNTVSYTGNINLSANSTTGNRAIGIYVSPNISGTIANDITVTGADAIGMYLAQDPGTLAAPTISYTGNLAVSSTGSSLADRGVGVVLDQNATFTLGAGSSVAIGGTNNIGFYVKQGASLNVSGGAVTNTVDGVFAYIEDGTIHFTPGSPVNINYANIIVANALGLIQNDATIPVGTRGLQASNGATVLNSATGVITATVNEAKAMVGTTGATLTNNGRIALTGEKSVGIYVEGGATATSAGDVSVGQKSAAYYAGKDSGSVGGAIIITGTASVGKDGTILYGGGGAIQYNGADIVLADQTTALTLADAGSTVDFNGHKITTGEKGVGVFVKDTGDYADITNLAKITVAKDGTGIYLANPTAAAAMNGNTAVDMAGDRGIGILTTQNGSITYGGAMSSTAAEVKGILSTGTGALENDGTISLTGDSSIGIYGENSAALLNAAGATVQVGSGTASQAAVALYGKNVGSVVNDGTVILAQEAVGLYGKNAPVTNTGIIQNAGGHNTGIYAEGGSASNTGAITLGDTSNGVYVANGTSLTNTGNITLGNTKSTGLYGSGGTSVNHLGGSITVGSKSAGVVSEAGNILIAAAANITAGESSTYVYTQSGNGDSYANLSLSDYSVGMYTRDGVLTNYGDITTGNSYVSATEQKISVAMATGTTDAAGNPVGGGTIVNQGNLYVTTDHSVGMAASNPTGVAENYGLIKVSGNEAYGMEGSNEAKITNYGNIEVIGDKSRGMAGTEKALVVNAAGAVIDVTGTKAEGIYVGRGAMVANYGTIRVNGDEAIGIHFGQGSDGDDPGILINEGTITVTKGSGKVNDGVSVASVGNIKIEDTGPTITVGNVVYDAPTLINGGYIELIDDALDFGTIKIASTEGHIGTISAASFAGGDFIVLPNATQGNNDPVHVIQYLNGVQNVPNNGTVQAISHSVSWLADLQTDPKDPNLARIVLVKIPYAELTSGTPAVEFGKGLDEIYEPAVGRELEMFDALDLISDKDELAETFDMELRGNIYANIQHRMEDVREIFDMAVDQLKQDRLYTKESTKIGLIGNGGSYSDKNPAIEDYDYKTTGFMILKEYDKRRYGRKVNWNLGFAYTKFEFDYGSSEKAYSLNLGVGYEDFILDSRRLKYHGRLEGTASKHEALRKIHLSNGVWSDEGKYWSWSVIWKNKLRYEFPVTVNGNVSGGVFASFHLGYGKYEGFGETGDGIRLELRGEDWVTARPGIGADLTYTKYTARGKWSLTGKGTAEYELGNFYDEANRAKIKDSGAGWYDLEKPKEVKGILKVSAGLKYETRAGHALGVEVVREEGTRRSTRIGVNFTYHFGL